MAERETGAGAAGRWATVALVLGGAAVVVSWVPILGLVLGLAAVGLGVAARRTARRHGALAGPVRVRTRRALGVGLFGLLLGLGFTVAWKACTPSVETPAERQDWEDFERAFEAPGGTGGGGAPGPAAPREPPATPPTTPPAR